MHGPLAPLDPLLKWLKAYVLQTTCYHNLVDSRVSHGIWHNIFFLLTNGLSAIGNSSPMFSNTWTARECIFFAQECPTVFSRTCSILAMVSVCLFLCLLADRSNFSNLALSWDLLDLHHRLRYTHELFTKRI